MARFRQASTMSLQTFMHELESRLDALNHEELKSAILEYARDLTSEERPGLLDIFPASRRSVAAAHRLSDTPDESLLGEIDGFIERLGAGEYYEGSGWDYETRDERDYGDESWVYEMDSLFSRASTEYLSGRREVAATAYGKLLGAFEYGQESGYFCGEDSPENMVNTDLTEARARCLRSLYETTPPERRVSRLIEGMEELDYIGGEISLRAMMEADTTPLPELDGFLPGWIDGMKSLESEGRTGVFRWWRSLLREAVLMQGGTDGLAALARESGDTHPEVYYDLVTALWRSGETASAISSARAGVAHIAGQDGRARLADALAAMASSAGDPDLSLSARQQAWRADPSLNRLLAYSREGSPDRPTLDARLHEEYLVAQDGGYIIPSSYSYEPAPSRLRILLYLLAHEYDAAIEYAGDIVPLGWSGQDNAGPVLFPFLVLAASGKTEAPDSGSALEYLLDQMPDSISGWGHVEPILPELDAEVDKPTAGELLVETLAAHPVSPGSRDLYLELAKSLARERINAVVSNLHRGAYERAGRLAVAVGEAMSLRGDRSGGSAFALSFVSAYPRHRAFRDEVYRLIDRSPYLPPTPSTKRR